MSLLRRYMIFILISVFYICFQIIDAKAEYFIADNYSKEQLIAIDNIIDAELQHDEIGNIVYDKDGMTISWNGFKYVNYINTYQCYIPKLLITNVTGKNINIGMKSLYANGYKIPFHISNIFTLLNEKSILTGVDTNWMFRIDSIEEYGIETIKTVAIELDIYGEDEFEPFDTISFEIATDKKVSRNE